jgi:phosphatidylserine decarboxylase
MKFHKEGRKIILNTIIFLVGINLLEGYFLGTGFLIFSIPVSLIILILILQFFRVPNRPLLNDDGLVYCPADGKVVVIEETEENEYLKEKRIQVSIFMSPLNVHINWYPIAGMIKYFKYHPGKYLVAWHPKSSTENERTTVVVQHKSGLEILVRQIAGAVARRIVSYAEENNSIDQNSEMGFIKFGSRVDVFLPLDAEVLVKIDDKVTGSQTPLARIKE